MPKEVEIIEDANWEILGANLAKALIRSEMVKRGYSYADLAREYEHVDINVSERHLRNKVSRGTFSAAWFFALMMILEVKTLDMSHLYKTLDESLEDPEAEIGPYY